MSGEQNLSDTEDSFSSIKLKTESENDDSYIDDDDISNTQLTSDSIGFNPVIYHIAGSLEDPIANSTPLGSPNSSPKGKPPTGIVKDRLERISNLSADSIPSSSELSSKTQKRLTRATTGGKLNISNLTPIEQIG
ncbi:unnamed protein product, partial [Meganyctiphanes norvegica]